MRDVVVVGAGPVGLLAAGLLARFGASVELLEAAASPLLRTRASTVTTRSMEILALHGVPREDFERVEAGHWAGARVDLQHLDSEHAGLWRLSQPRLCATLRRWTEEAGVVHTAPWRVVDVAQDDDGVSVRSSTGESRRARFLLGCDGADGTVRAAAGIAVRTRPARHRFLRADVQGRPVAARRFERVGDLTVTSGPLEPGTARIMIHDRGRRTAFEADPRLVCALWHQATGQRLDPDWLEWVEAFDDEEVVVTTLRSGRVLLAGDAVRQCLPVGGECLNAGLLDAHALAWRLSAVLAGAPSDLVDAGVAERLAATWRGVDDVREQVDVLYGGLPPTGAPSADRADRVAGLDLADPSADPPVGRRLADRDLVALVGPARAEVARASLREGVAVLVGEVEAETVGGRRVRLLPRLDGGSTVVLLRPDGHPLVVHDPETALARALDAACPRVGVPVP